jgi:D-alanine transaminase
MPNLVYLNGQYLPRAQATLDIDDRGVQFADGVYEVVRYHRGVALEMPRHVQRLHDSLAAVRIALSHELPGAQMATLSDELVARNGLRDATVYWQVTRGVAPRKHLFGDLRLRPTVLITATPATPLDYDAPTPTGAAITHEDLRWQCCGIKSLMLLPNVLARQTAAERGCYEAILIRAGVVTEATATSVFAVVDGELRTHPADGTILPSVTRALLIERARAAGIAVREAAVTADELVAAAEILICGTSTHVMAITRLDGRTIGTSLPGPLTNTLHRLLMDHIAAACGR